MTTAEPNASCSAPPHVGPLLGAYVLGALRRREVRTVERHLRRCPLCAEERARLAALPRLLDSAAPRQP
jgi:anti-sigma factor RsiW